MALGFGQTARDAGDARSMRPKGDAYDNAVAESIEAFYNRVRQHSTLGMLAPLEVENLMCCQRRAFGVP